MLVTIHQIIDDKNVKLTRSVNSIHCKQKHKFNKVMEYSIAIKD